MTTTESPKSVVERTPVFFCTPFIEISSGKVTNFSISSALRPDHCVMMVTWVLVTSGKASMGVFRKLVMPLMMITIVKKKTANLFFNENVRSDFMSEFNCSTHYRPSTDFWSLLFRLRLARRTQKFCFW